MLFFVQPHASQMPVLSATSPTAMAITGRTDIHYARNTRVDEPPSTDDRWHNS